MTRHLVEVALCEHLASRPLGVIMHISYSCAAHAHPPKSYLFTADEIVISFQTA